MVPQIHIRGNESMQELRKLIKNNEILVGIVTVGKGRKKSVIVEEIRQRISSVHQQLV